MADIHERVSDALAKAFGHDMMNRWVLAAEVIEPNGTRAVWVCTPEDATEWDTLGLLTFALQQQQADILRTGLDDA